MNKQGIGDTDNLEPTGVYVTSQELAEIIRLLEQTMAVHDRSKFKGINIKSGLWNHIHAKVNKFAIKHGLPDTGIDYGLDLDGQFLQVAPASNTEINISKKVHPVLTRRKKAISTVLRKKPAKQPRKRNKRPDTPKTGK